MNAREFLDKVFADGIRGDLPYARKNIYQVTPGEMLKLAKALPPRREDIVVRALGIDGNPRVAFSDLAEWWEITRSRVGQLFWRAMRDMRTASKPPVAPPDRTYKDADDLSVRAKSGLRNANLWPLTEERLEIVKYKIRDGSIWDVKNVGRMTIHELCEFVGVRPLNRSEAKAIQLLVSRGYTVTSAAPTSCAR